ncbi:hypothetical protein GCK72_023070 [Caenorhabditis remanei]|uniref:Uncharacterized protein n=1 Tax=Caenorhabditis remanei TaxID=31234 RepID=A0A6A5FVP0_CAERE|nr:hypothetical protein GCK72_023070 [Caenorhabditis remanei]KAF1746613.1 hypothetical protein GCK72_023070 [Caenorhabditis remanei]
MEDDADDNESVFSNVSTFRAKGETLEQRKLQKAAVKEARKQRKIEKKANNCPRNRLDFHKILRQKRGNCAIALSVSIRQYKRRAAVPSLGSIGPFCLYTDCSTRTALQMFDSSTLTFDYTHLGYYREDDLRLDEHL